MIDNKEKLIVYLNTLVNSIFKILPLFEEKNIGVNSYIESLLGELYKLEKAVKIEHSYEYISLLATLEFVKEEVFKEEGKKPVIKRELFKSIHIVKNMVGKLEGE